MHVTFADKQEHALAREVVVVIKADAGGTFRRFASFVFIFVLWGINVSLDCLWDFNQFSTFRWHADNAAG
uniref:Uncharacterized protein n=1 Tax=Oryza nivara TaxID=4536 RepID=A0A0E0HCH5_ORYNI